MSTSQIRRSTGEGKESAFEISPNKMLGIKDPFFWFQEKVGLESHVWNSERYPYVILYRKTMEIVCPNTIIWNNCLWHEGWSLWFFHKLHVFTFAHVEQLTWRNHHKKEYLGLLHNSKRCDLVITQLGLSKVDDFIILPPFNSFLWIFFCTKKEHLEPICSTPILDLHILHTEDFHHTHQAY